MIFTSFEFVLFFCLFAGIRSCIKNFTTEKMFMLVASYLFYMSWSIPCGSLILLTSMIDFLVGLRLGKTSDPFQRKALLISSLVANLGVLAYFKYTNFFLSTTGWGLRLLGFPSHLPHLDILLPAGISFFTFQSMSYTIDVYRRQIQPCQNCRDFLLFVAFFPQLLAGPIVRAAEFLPQLLKRARPSVSDIEAGLALFALGAVKKLVISDQLAPHVEVIFAHPESFDTLTLIQGLLGYSVQIYCDFSGYSDMAIASARLLGYRFPDNFQMPYASSNITEFWRRWHMSLSTWLRDYLYIPLGGNRSGRGRTYFNLMVTMLLGGLWHGASWNFVLWGAIHGLALAGHRFWREWLGDDGRQDTSPTKLIWKVASHTLTLATVFLGWIFFRSQTFDGATAYILGMVTRFNSGTHLISPHILAGVAAVVLVHLLIDRRRDWAAELPSRSVPYRFAAYTLLIAFITVLGSTDASPFIYFQF